jgi:hypothetical protein
VVANLLVVAVQQQVLFALVADGLGVEADNLRERGKGR